MIPPTTLPMMSLGAKICLTFTAAFFGSRSTLVGCPRPQFTSASPPLLQITQGSPPKASLPSHDPVGCCFSASKCSRSRYFSLFPTVRPFIPVSLFGGLGRAPSHFPALPKLRQGSPISKFGLELTPNPKQWPNFTVWFQNSASANLWRIASMSAQFCSHDCSVYLRCSTVASTCSTLRVHSLVGPFIGHRHSAISA